MSAVLTTGPSTDLAAAASARAPAPAAVAALRASLSAGEPALAEAYAALDHRPIWIEGRTLRPEAGRLVELLARADEDGLDPARYDVDGLRSAVRAARGGDPAALAEAERRLSLAYARWTLDLRAVPGEARPVVTDPEALPDLHSLPATLAAAARAPDLSAHLQRRRLRHPVHDALAARHEAWVRRWGGLPATTVPDGAPIGPGSAGPRVAALRARLGLPAAATAPDRFDATLEARLKDFQTDHGLSPTGRADAATLARLNEAPAVFEARLRANLLRARALPAPSGRHLLVDTAAQTLWMYEGSRVVGSMPVVVGKPAQPTPMLAGVVRYAVFEPYWNLPPDLAGAGIARRVLASGPGRLEAEHMEVLSDWTDEARVLKAEEVDWAGAVAGRTALRVRQKPGPWNMMGRVKFMLPNTLGIYLHDTPDKALFERETRAFSAGCVRVSDPDRLAAWLFGESEAAALITPRGQPERRVDLTDPVPVYLTYFTVAPEGEGLTVRPDLYGRDRALIASQIASLSGEPGGAASWRVAARP